jgi:hypothetical protein
MKYPNITIEDKQYLLTVIYNIQYSESYDLQKPEYMCDAS